MHISGQSGRKWYPDSGASVHITDSSEHLQTATPYNGPENIMVADGTYLPIIHVGSTTLPTPSGSLPLHDVLVCPDIQKSLLSVSSSPTFKEQQCYYQQ